MASYSRFDDEEYKNWLKTTMSLQLLRSRLGGFIENETETYHNSLRNKLKEAICKNTCSSRKIYKNKVSSVCPDCQLWIDEILKNHNNKNMEIYWTNCKPHLWSFNKWELAKVYMPRGNKDHHAVDQFDISAIVNLMIFCSHFKKFVKDQVLKEVTNVRNQMMHSPDMKVAKEDMKKHLKKILNFVGHLRAHVPELNELENEINQLEEAELNIKVEGQDTNSGDVMNLLNNQKILDLEQQVMKEKIGHLASRLEEDKELNNEEYLRMKEFLDQNKDLLKQLGPQMEKLNEIEEKVEQHDKQLTVLSETVDQMVKKTEEPVFSADMVKYKNHLFEEAKKNNWPDPEFTEVRRPLGYIGQVAVNGQVFTGRHVHPKVKAAHQEVAMIALEQMNMQPTEEGSLTLHHADQSASTSADTDIPVEHYDSAAGQATIPAMLIHTYDSLVHSANSLFFMAVKVPLKTDFEGPEAETLEAAVLEAYKSLEQAFNLGDMGAGSPSDGARQRVHDFFSQAGCGPPEERNRSTNGKFRSKLCINGDLTFQNPEGMSKKLHAEQAAAKEALLRLAEVLGWDLVGVNENYKGRLQEILVKQGHTPPSYQRTEPSNRGAESEKSLASVPVLQATVSASNIESQARASVDSSQCPPQLQQPKTETPGPVIPAVQTPESNLPQSSGTDVPVDHYDSAAGQIIVPVMSTDTNESSVPSATSQFFMAVKVPVKTDFEGPEAETLEAAVLEAYKSLEQALNLGDMGAGSPSDGARQRVHDFFSQAGCGPPEECTSITDGKFRSQLCINGDLTFQNPEAMSKKLKAEQAAAKEALLRLAGVLGWDLAGVNENYKGRLQEILLKQGHTPPSYQRASQPSHREPSNRGAESQKSLASVPVLQATVSESNIESQARASVDSSQYPPQLQKPKIETPAPVMPTVQPPESILPQSSVTDVPVDHYDSAAGQIIVPVMSIDTNESSVPSANSLFFMAVKVPLKTDFEGPEAETLEAAVLEAYKSLEQAFNLGDMGAGSPSDGAWQRVHDFFSQAGCGPPEECTSITDGKFRSQLCINGDLNFQNPEAMSKKLKAEQAAAKEALLRLAGVLGWDLAGVNENYKGRLQEILLKQGHTPPSYQRVSQPSHREPSNREAESQKSLASVPVLQATVSVNIESQARASVDSSQCPPQLQNPKIETPAPVMPTVQPPESKLPQSSGTDVPVDHYDSAAGQIIVPVMSTDTNESSVSSANSLFFMAVKVPVKTDFEGPEAETLEAAVLEAYKSLEQAFNLGDMGAGSPSDGARQRVHDFFSQAGCGPPEECTSITDGKFRSQLCINGDLTFHNPEAMSKKLKAEQAAAKEALLRLAGVLGWDLAGVNENYKGRLQEILLKQGQTPPSYQRVSQPSHTEPSNRGAASVTNGADVSTPLTAEPVSTVKTLRKQPVDQAQLLPDRKKSKLDPDFGRMLKMFGLQPTSVIFENLNVKEKVRLTVEINLDDFAYTNQQGYQSKKDAIRKTYLKFGQAIGICGPSTEENQSSMAVKQYFSQKSLSLPTEGVVEKEQKFFCSLKVPSCRFSYEGQGESEEAAKLGACTQALSQLGPLFDYKLTCSSVEAEDRLTLLLEEAHQGPPALQKSDTQYKATVQLNLNDFTLEGKGQNSKKSAQSQLCHQILMLLGEEETTETKKSISERNRVDDWFKQKQLPRPVFEDTKESAPDNRDVFRMRATFSGCITCTHPDWQASEEEAVNELMDELKRRFQDC